MVNWLTVAGKQEEEEDKIMIKLLGHVKCLFFADFDDDSAKSLPGGQTVGGQGSEGQDQAEASDMGEVGPAEEMEEFLGSGRTGRRNALPDITDEVAGTTTTADLPLDMAKLSCADGTQGNGPATAGNTSSDSKPS